MQTKTQTNRFLIAIFFIAVCRTSIGATGLEDLENFVKSAKSGRTEFTQLVTAPAKDGQASRSKSSSGTFEFLRPGKFKFVYRKPYEQSIVADGQTLWLHDVDLNQVTSRKQAQALGSTPAALIASASDLKALEADFSLNNGPLAEGMLWVLATPKATESPLQSVRVGFRGGALAVLEILDSFGQKSRLTFTGFDARVKLENGDFQFKVPAGADVIKQ